MSAFTGIFGRVRSQSTIQRKNAEKTRSVIVGKGLSLNPDDVAAVAKNQSMRVTEVNETGLYKHTLKSIEPITGPLAEATARGMFESDESAQARIEAIFKAQ